MMKNSGGRDGEAKDRRRDRRWDAPAPPLRPPQPPVRLAGPAPSSAVHVIEPYVSDAEAIAALVGSTAAAASRTQSGENRRRSEYPDNTQKIRKRRWNETKSLDSQKGTKYEADNILAGGGNNDASNGNVDSAGVSVEKKKANFGLSGALATDSQTGNNVNGVVLKFTEPPEARMPDKEWRLYLFNKDDKSAEPFKILAVNSKSSYLIGRDIKVADIPLMEADGKTISNTCSKQHCVLQYRGVPAKRSLSSYPGNENAIVCKPYLMDLKSTNGTYVNGTRLDDSRYYELKESDVVTVGRSNVEYVLICS